MNSGNLNKVWEIRALKRKPNEESARKLLEKIANQVQPIMRKHNWRVKVLSEMCPKNASLLGLNVGAGVQVKLRLRRPNRENDFIPYHEVLDTMLHELCHNAHGPHNASFYRLWDELRKECEDLINNGISGSGQGFDAPGKLLGGRSAKPPLSSLRKAALAAAENRSRLGSLLPSGPKRIGGDSSIMAALSPVQAAAMAAERRLKDNIWCGSEYCDEVEQDESTKCSGPMSKCSADHTAGKSTMSQEFSRQGERTSRKRSREIGGVSSLQHPYSEGSFIDLTEGSLKSESTLYADEISLNKIHQMQGKIGKDVFSDNRPNSSFIDLSGDASTSQTTCNSELGHNKEGFQMWECTVCTLLNPPLAPVCELCTTERSKDGKLKHFFWSCKFCTLENDVKLEKCAACGEWRYSYGPPAVP